MFQYISLVPSLWAFFQKYVVNSSSSSLQGKSLGTRLNFYYMQKKEHTKKKLKVETGNEGILNNGIQP